VTGTATQDPTDGTAALRTALLPGSGQVVVRLEGDVDASTAPLVAEALRARDLSDVPLVVLEVGDAHFWDVSGLHVIAAFSSGLAAAGRCCRIAGATATTRRLIELADFTSTLLLQVN
jgi:anti-anti-sigma factor